MTNSVEHVQSMRAQLESIFECIPRFGANTERLPIIDVLETGSQVDGQTADENEDEDAAAISSASGKSTPNTSSSIGGGDGDGATKGRTALHLPHTGIPGLRGFRENIWNDVEQIDKFLARHAQHRTTVSASAFSTNAPYLVAVWNELVHAHPPILFVDKTFPIPPPEVKDGVRPASPSVTFSRRGAMGVKVDVVSENGKQWIRVNTIRNTRLLAELRELDSYLTESSSEEDDDPEEQSGDDAKHNSNPSREAKFVPEELDNSLLQMGKALVSAAQAFVSDLEAAENATKRTPPRITLRLTRLLLDSKSLAELERRGLRVIGLRERSITPDPKEMDYRIAQSLRELLQMGIEVVLGEHEFRIPPDFLSPLKRPSTRLIPSRHINLDLSVLIALISDITHAPLPSSVEEVHRRYIPTPAERERSRRRKQQQKEQNEMLAQAKARTAGKTKARLSKAKAEVAGKDSADNSESDGEGESIQSRALTSQAQREIELSLLDEIASRLPIRQSTSKAPSGLKESNIEFWTSKEARDRCLRIVSKIGGPAEKRRAAALFFDPYLPNERVLGIRFGSGEEAIRAYWLGSRHQRDMISGLVPLRIFEEEDDHLIHRLPRTDATRDEVSRLSNPFWTNLERTCAHLLSSGSTSHPRSITNPSPSVLKKKGSPSTGEIERASVIRLNPRLTTHTVSTLYRGALRKWTTLTANRASVGKIIKECSKVKEGAGSEDLVGRISSLGIDGKVKRGRGDNGISYSVEQDVDEEVAAIWVVEPRSLAESMRSDYVPA